MTTQTPHPGPPPAPGRVDPRALRPRRIWYVVGPGIFALCCLLAVGIFIWTLYGAFSGFTELDEEPTKARLSPDDDMTLYASKPSTLAFAAKTPCQLSGPGHATFEPIFGSETLTKDGTKWYAIAHVHVTTEGEYSTSCSSVAPVRFAIGGKFTVFGLVGSIFGLFLVPFVGFIAGGVIVLVTALRRNGHKKRLLAAAAGPPPGPPGPWQGGPPPGHYPPPPPGPGPRGPYGTG